MRIPLFLVLAFAVSCYVLPHLSCPEEEVDGYVWPRRDVGESAVRYCNGEGYYRRICLYKKTPSGPVAAWSRLVNMCSGLIRIRFHRRMQRRRHLEGDAGWAVRVYPVSWRL